MGLQEVTTCSDRCKTCIHRTNVTGMITGQGTIACVYILDKHERRGCPAGDKCDKYEKGKTMNRFKQQISRRQL